MMLITVQFDKNPYKTEGQVVPKNEKKNQNSKKGHNSEYMQMKNAYDVDYN